MHYDFVSLKNQLKISLFFWQWYSCCPLATLKFFFLSSNISIFLYIVFRVFILPRDHMLLESATWYLSSVVKKFLPVSIKYYFCTIFSLLSFWNSTNMLDFLTWFHTSLRFSSLFSKLLSFCALVWIFTSDLSLLVH